jgi:hypothetical protein
MRLLLLMGSGSVRLCGPQRDSIAFSAGGLPVPDSVVMRRFPPFTTLFTGNPMSVCAKHTGG